MNKMRPVLVTNCSSRKSARPEDRLHAADLPKGRLDAVGRTWLARLKAHNCWLPAAVMYNGRGFQEARKASMTADAKHWIVSAGLGLVSETEQIPAYDLTISGSGANQIKTKIEGNSFTSELWWQQVSKRKQPYRTIKRLVEDNPRSTVVLALPTNYFKMVLGDLGELDPSSRRRLRIIGPPNRVIPTSLKPFWLPYDARLDGPDGTNPGTRSDFTQRAARHFFEIVWPLTSKGSAKTHVRAVQESLAPLAYPAISKRRQLSDCELVCIIQDLWPRAHGRAGHMLRILRDEEQIACEQGRFKKLFHQAKERMG